MYGGNLEFADGTLANPTEGERTFMHELGHALTLKRTGGLTYYGESGAVDESLADVISMLVSQPGRWGAHIGQEHERNISDPTAAGNPATYEARMRGTYDRGEVHLNSVILSHALWLTTVAGLEVGLEHVEGVGYDDMTAIIDELLSGHLGGTVTLHQTAASLIDACMVYPMFYDAFGTALANLSFRDCGLLVNALAEVGLSSPDRDLDGWPDDADNCPKKPNPYQEDSDSDMQGDACEAVDDPPDAVACPLGLTINGIDWTLPDYFTAEGVPKQSSWLNDVNGLTVLQCPYLSTDEHVSTIRINYVFTRPDDPPSVPSCGALAEGGVVIDIQSTTHSIGANWSIIHNSSIKPTDPEFAVYENAARDFAESGMAVIEPFAASCD
jgi:hypothetical protein